MQADQVLGVRQAAQAGRVSPSDVELEAAASLSAQPDSGIFQGFAGCIKAEMQWLPLQWTFLSRGAHILCPPRRIRAGHLAPRTPKQSHPFASAEPACASRRACHLSSRDCSWGC